MHTKCHHQNDDQEDNHPFPFDFRFDVVHIPFFFSRRTRRKGRRFRRLKRTIYQLTQSVIQTTVGRKNPGSIHVYVIEILRFALNDMTRVSTNILLPIKKVANHRLATFFLRRERDSNPRYLAVQRFSRPPQSTTLPSLQNSFSEVLVFKSDAKVRLFFESANISVFFFEKKSFTL